MSGHYQQLPEYNHLRLSVPELHRVFRDQPSSQGRPATQIEALRENFAGVSVSTEATHVAGAEVGFGSGAGVGGSESGSGSAGGTAHRPEVPALARGILQAMASFNI